MASLMDLVTEDCNCTFQGTGIAFGDLSLSDEFKEEWMGFIRYAENDPVAREFTQYYFEALQQCNLEIQKQFEEIDNFYNSTLQFLKNAPLIISEKGIILGKRKCEVDDPDEWVGKRKRGNLPKKAVSLLKEWLTKHSSHPFPTDEEKQALCEETGLALNQLCNWFINARRRILPKIIQAKSSC